MKTKKAKAVKKKNIKPIHNKNVLKNKSHYDLEDIIIDMLLNSDINTKNGTDIEDLIYSSTRNTAKLGYYFGFSVGRSMALKLDSRKEFIMMLDRIGLHNALYHPLRDHIIIMSKPEKNFRRSRLAYPIHVYEAGVIAGYLSTSSGMKINVNEKRCVYNGASECQFVASPEQSAPALVKNGISGISHAIAASFNNGAYSKSLPEYHRILSNLPLIDGGISSQVLKIMVLSGEKMPSMTTVQFNRVVSNIANYYGVNDYSIERRGSKKIIKFRYGNYNSLHSFVSMPAAIIVGISNSMGKRPQVSFVTNRDKSYTTIIELS